LKENNNESHRLVREANLLDPTRRRVSGLS
jgi:hypothetical protein